MSHPPSCVSIVPHGKSYSTHLSQALSKLGIEGQVASSFFNPREPEIVIGWTGQALHPFQRLSHAEHWLVSDTSHANTRLERLSVECERLGIPTPSISRTTLQEYEFADRILVLSDSARQSFIEAGHSPQSVDVIELGVDRKHFSESEVYFAPVGRALRVVALGYFDALSGVQYLLEATSRMAQSDVTLTLVGEVAPEMESTFQKYSHFLLKPMLPTQKLGEFLRTQDVVVSPTLDACDDRRIRQAMASGVVPIVTEFCPVSTKLTEKKIGKVVLASSHEALIDALTNFAEKKNEVIKGRLAVVQYSEYLTWERCFFNSVKEVFSHTSSKKVNSRLAS